MSLIENSKEFYIYTTIIGLVLETGVEIEEILLLKIGQINLQDNKVIISFPDKSLEIKDSLVCISMNKLLKDNCEKDLNKFLFLY